MRGIVTENIIRNALNESIDEFMLEEGEGWNRLKNSKLGQIAKNVGNSLWNGVKMYMDYRTNGQWNNKYGQYANGNGKTTELYYLNKWFNYHLNGIRQASYEMQTPNNGQTIKRWKKDLNGNEYYDQTINNFNSIKDYVAQNINPSNFNKWIKYYISNRHSLMCIDNYITKCSKLVTNLNTAIEYLNVGKFLSDDTGKEYLENNRKQLYRKQINNNYYGNNAAQTNNRPVPNNPDGTFATLPVPSKYNGSQYPKYSGVWIRGVDKNNRQIIINPQDKTQAIFVND